MVQPEVFVTMSLNDSIESKFQVGLSRSTTGCVAACLFREFQLTAAYEGLVETVPGVNTALLRMDKYEVGEKFSASKSWTKRFFTDTFSIMCSISQSIDKINR